MNYYIITGTSSGIGEAIARKLILQKHKLFCISRRMNESVSDLASSAQSQLWYYEADLSQTGNISKLMNEIFGKMDSTEISAIALINNAAMLEPVMPAGRYDNIQLQQHLNVNLLAPMILTNEFIRHTKDLNLPKTIVNIGSGAASSPYEGWGPYCTSKAGLEMFTRTTALEQKNALFPVRLLSIAPGIVDTPMQARIRQVDSDDFPMKPRFEQLYQHNQLSRPVDVADKIIGMLWRDLPDSSEIIDLRKI
jgi:benzil reductase ((S)-benzoin forming)